MGNLSSSGIKADSSNKINATGATPAASTTTTTAASTAVATAAAKGGNAGTRAVAAGKGAAARRKPADVCASYAAIGAVTTMSMSIFLVHLYTR